MCETITFVVIVESICMLQAKAILNIDPHLQLGRKHKAVVQEKFLVGIGKAEQVRSSKTSKIRIRICKAGLAGSAGRSR